MVFLVCQVVCSQREISSTIQFNSTNDSEEVIENTNDSEKVFLNIYVLYVSLLSSS